jgi:4-hydroxy-3-methylbut-2-enyl diphosphate reductase
MKVKLARTAGFCMGVRRAMNIALDVANKKKGEIYTYGPLVHNPQAVEMLRNKGVEILRDQDVKNATIIIRAHGISPDERHRLKESGNTICDATCPHVARAHAIIKRQIKEGYNIIIIGDKGHAEVEGLLGHAEGKGFVIENEEDLRDLPSIDRACVVAQTTQERERFNRIVERIKQKIPDTKVFDTICDSTSMRQREVVKLANEVEAMVIVGGKNSANTRRLYEISLSTGTPSFHIEDEDELDALGLERYRSIGVMAGASTPNWVINKVIDRIRYLMKKQQNWLFRIAYSVGEFIVESSLFLSLGAMSMCYTSLIFQHITPSLRLILIAALYVFSVHVFNRYYERIKDEFWDPARTRFFKQYGKLLMGGAIVSALLSLYLSLGLGLVSFMLLLFSFLMGIIYNMKIIPEGFPLLSRYKRLRDIPGSKDIFVSFAWTWVIALIPMLEKPIIFTYDSLSIILFVMLTVFTRSIIFDVISIEGDRIVGNETIPILIGQQNTQRMLCVITLILGIYMSLSSFFDLIPTLGYFLVIPQAIMVLCIYMFQKRRLPISTSFEALIDSNFILAGAMGFLYTIVQ